MHKQLLSLFLFTFFSCTTKDSSILKVAVSPVPHAEMLEEIKQDLKDRDVNVEIIVVDDYNLPNRMLQDKEIDANFFQHTPFLDAQKQEFHYQLTPFAKIHLEPMGLYSQKIKSITAIPDKSKVAIPNDPTNEARALKLLERAGLIEINPNVSLKATTADIIANPKQLQIIEIDAPMLPRTLKEVALAAIPSNFALGAGLNPVSDPLIKEDADSPYANILVIRSGDISREDLKLLKQALTSEKMRTFILERYQGAIIPTF